MNMVNCPRCNTANPDGANFCNNCGYNLSADAGQSLVCAKCGESYPPGTKYCTKDGSQLVSADMLIPKCIKCGTEYLDGTKFCPKDGGAIIAEAFRVKYTEDYYSRTGDFYPKASVGSRFLAALIDGFITLGLCIPSIAFSVIAISKWDRYYDRGEAWVFIFFAILFYVFPVGYSFIKDGIGQGQSYGKKTMDLMVVDLDTNMPCSRGKSALRHLVSTLLGIIPYVGWLIEPIILLSDSNGRKLGDRAANTQVIEKMHYVKAIR